MTMTYLRNVTTLQLEGKLCTGCRSCLNVCPRGVFEVEGKRAVVVDRDACIECGACALNCPDGALAVRTGVGCAAAILNGRLGRRDACCVVDGESEFGSCN